MTSNRAVTLTGANEIFKPLLMKEKTKITQSELGFYELEHGSEIMQAKTLTKLCQKLVCKLSGIQWVDFTENN
jgi:hypothetical protein